jgi:2-polyprenyl-3-methyl-5-hydroxy-6-metoxy-1,4-benzoquinol methylase
MQSKTNSLIHFGASSEAWSLFTGKVYRTIIECNAKSVCEVGGGANPLLSLESVTTINVSYVILDSDAKELAKAPTGYRARVQDITAQLCGEQSCYDLVVTKMVAEHVRDPQKFHGNIYKLLKPGGIAIHFFPTLYAPPYLLNAMIPDRLSSKILRLVQSGRESEGSKGKFPAYYRWCRGPTTRQFRRLESVGFKVLRYDGFFGHSGYYEKSPVLKKIHERLAGWLVLHPLPWLTSFAQVVLQKPAQTEC